MEFWLVILGAIISAISSVITQIAIWYLQRKSEERKRAWSLEDIQRDRQTLILDGRIGEIEKLARTLSRNFNEKRLAFTQYITDYEKNDEIPDFAFEILKKTKEAQSEYYAIIPMIISIDSKKTKLMEHWEKTADIDSKLNKIIINEPVYPKDEGYDPHLTIKKIAKLRIEFNYALADFYKDLNILQINTLKEPFEFNICGQN